ncbi:MAG: molybdenum cofactor guanylyltransferase [Thermoplasmata archaeon]|nr:molybdenum cofactor guanylyltransferase [Candidatus Thermoplasmatota archaeon]MCK4949734.1 molybdenum cofactor guanylyltransferase [Thermoplasmata archaeon]
MHVSVAILTGGNSSRFGRSKQLHEIEGRPLYSMCYEKFTPLSDDVFLQGGFAGADVDVRGDIVSGVGPIGGLYSALMNARHERVFVLACDMPHLDPRILTLLLEHGESELVVPKWRNGYLEPLCSLYSKTQAPILREMMDGGVLKISRLFTKVERSEFPVIDDWIEEGLISKDCFLNMNEMPDYRD